VRGKLLRLKGKGEKPGIPHSLPFILKDIHFTIKIDTITTHWNKYHYNYITGACMTEETQAQGIDIDMYEVCWLQFPMLDLPP
jgi:superoxide dismutase